MFGKNFYTIAFLMLLSALGISYFYSNKTEAKSVSQKMDNLNTNLMKLENIIRFVNEYYVDDPNYDKAFKGAIDGLLEKLDPHSSYLPPKEQASEEEEFTGKFGGIGIQFEIKDKLITVISPIPETPAYKLGVKPGDKIIEIDGKSAFGISNEEVFKRLKGEIGTKVKITIQREGLETNPEYTIIRAEIPINSVVADCMLDDGKTGYIKINKFAYHTSDELEKALIYLENKGMKQFILDLRGNPGGIMTQAVNIADKFISGNKLLLYTKGRVQAFDERFYSTDNTTHKNYPIIILIDAGTASASEIVTGALQDYDRAFVLGTRSFGKGLVQKPFPLGDGSVLRLVISRYYTPSGRLIQRPYDKGKYAYYMDRYVSEKDLSPKELAIRDSIKNSNVFYTLRKHRKVYGGGGITPDSIVNFDPSTKILNNLLRKGIFEEFSIKFYNKNLKNFVYKNNFDEFCKNFMITDFMLEEFCDIANNNKIAIGEKYKTEDKEYKNFTSEDLNKSIVKIKNYMKYYVARQFFNDIKLYPRVEAMTDKHVQIALTLFGKAAKLNEN